MTYQGSGGPCGPSPYGPNASSGPLEPVVAQPRGALQGYFMGIMWITDRCLMMFNDV